MGFQALLMFSSLPRLALLDGVRTTGNVVFVSPEARVWFSPLWAQEKLTEVSQVTLLQVLALQAALQVKDIHSGQVVTAPPWLVTSHPLGATVHPLPVPPLPQLLAVQRLSVTCVVKPLSG